MRHPVGVQDTLFGALRQSFRLAGMQTKVCSSDAFPPLQNHASGQENVFNQGVATNRAFAFPPMKQEQALIMPNLASGLTPEQSSMMYKT